MNKERLQEIKDSIDFQREFLIASNMQTLCVDEEMELYNEIIRLKKQKDDVVEYIKSHTPSDIGICGNKKKYYYTLGENSVDELLRMLGEIDVED